MSLSDLASIGTLLGSIAVLASLVYLSLQIRQSGRNQRALMDQGTVTRNIDILMFLSQPHIHNLTTRVAAGDVDFTAEELDYLQLRLRATLLTHQDTYIQHKAGLVDEITYEIAWPYLDLSCPSQCIGLYGRPAEGVTPMIGRAISRNKSRALPS